MVKINGKVEYDPTTMTAKASLFADSQGEVGSDMTIVGFDSDYQLAAGSSCMTADKDFGLLDSQGTWHF